MNKKLQVFVSSTYTDLIEERQIVITSILNANHTPINIDFINVENKSQLEADYKLIDECDIFILILGGQYGSIIENTCKSYIELEYKYALSKNKPIISLVLTDTFLFTKAMSCGEKNIFEKNHIYQYNTFKSLVFTNIVRIIRSISDIQAIIYNYFYMYSLQPYLNEIRKSPGFISYLFVNTNLLDKSYYHNIIRKEFDIAFATDIVSNKCILDPSGNPISDITNIRIDISEVNDWMLNELNKNPTDLYQLSSRRFEELIAEILMRKGYNVELTPATRDGGKDIYVAHKDDLGSFLYLVECKKYDPNHKVGVSVIRDLYGVLSKEKATYGIVVTTSDFTKPAQDFQQDVKFQMSLKNYNSIQKWLCSIT